MPGLPHRNSRSILVIRRDNIGDLLCTTPMISGLRIAYPDARIDALVNSYNAPVLLGNPDLNNVYYYTKAKHRAEGQTVLGVYWLRLKLLLTLRRAQYDCVYLAGDGNIDRLLKLARWLGAKEIVGFSPVSGERPKVLNHPVPRREFGHEVERCWALLGDTCGSDSPGPMTLHALSKQKSLVEGHLSAINKDLTQGPLVAVHISARKVPQRWPAASFVALIRALHQEFGVSFMLFWSPGDEGNPHHPGDDRKAAEIMASVSDLPVVPYPTVRLDELTGGLSACSLMICSDGGAMHMGAALGLPIVGFFGNSDITRWYPWAVPHVVLQKPSRDVVDIAVDEALSACRQILRSRAP